MHIINIDILINVIDQIPNYLGFQHSHLNWIIYINHIQFEYKIT